jgi:hypothetical protein
VALSLSSEVVLVFFDVSLAVGGHDVTTSSGAKMEGFASFAGLVTLVLMPYLFNRDVGRANEMLCPASTSIWVATTKEST